MAWACNLSRVQNTRRRFDQSSSGVGVSDLICSNCNVRKGTERWVGEYDSVTVARTGWHQMWCKRCVVVAQLEHAKRLAATIPELENQLAAFDRLDRLG